MWFECALSIAGCSTQKTIDSISNPNINGGVVWLSLNESREVDREEGTVLLSLGIGGPDGGIRTPNGLPPENEEDVQLVIRLYCK